MPYGGTRLPWIRIQIKYIWIHNTAEEKCHNLMIYYTTFLSLSPLGGSGAAKFEDIPRGDQAVLPPLSSQAEV